jgi:hypothetical protein
VPSADDARRIAIELVQTAEALLPGETLPDLPPAQFTSGEPDWYRFEHEIWRIGEQIRQLLNRNPRLRGDRKLLNAFLRIALDRRAKRGRQSFILLFAYKPCASFAGALIGETDDPGVCGHVIEAMLKMRAPGYVDRIAPFCDHRHAWIRNKAKQYCARYRT